MNVARCDALLVLAVMFGSSIWFLRVVVVVRRGGEMALSVLAQHLYSLLPRHNLHPLAGHNGDSLHKVRSAIYLILFHLTSFCMWMHHFEHCSILELALWVRHPLGGARMGQQDWRSPLGFRK